jgi:Holliday junction resolvase RusA-like endonuclease
VIEFFVAGIPKSMAVSTSVRWKTKDGSRQGSHQIRSNTEWAAVVGQIARENAPIIPWTKPIQLGLVFYMPRPKSSKKEVYPTKRPDIDNLFHKLTDQLNGVFWADDSQVVTLSAGKRFSTDDQPPGLRVVIEEIE